MGARGCVPMYLVAEKRYCVAAKIVETFLDPEFNNAFSMGFTSDFVTKFKSPTMCTTYSRTPLSGVFAEIYRKPDDRSSENNR